MEPTEDAIKLWQHIHGASSHFPIALIIASFLFDFGSVLFKRPTWRIVGFWTLFTAAVVAVPTMLSGFTGLNGWFHVEKWDAASQLTHRNVAIGASILLLVLVGWRIARKDGMAKGELAAYLLLAAILTGAIGYVGYLGAYVARGY